MSFSLSSRALKRLKELRKKELPFLRIRVDAGGCAGFQYCFLFDDTPTPDDFVLEQEGVSVLIDHVSLPFLTGATLDFNEEMIGASFMIANPQATQSCGCKNSFEIG